MKTNIKTNKYTHEGSKAPRLTDEQILSRTVLSCLLWENSFCEDGQSVADRIKEYARKVNISFLADLILKSHTIYKLRHTPLLLATILLERRHEKLNTYCPMIEAVLSRVDQVAELISIYWKDGKKPLPNKMKKAINNALLKFDAYQFGKYQGKQSAIKLVDVFNLTHPKPKTEEHKQLFKQIITGTLASPDTWEVALSTGADKKETFERLLKEGKLGYTALLRNLRNMGDAGVDNDLIKQAILERKGASKVLPFRFISASRANPHFEKELDKALLASVKNNVFPERTAVVVDVSASMTDKLSAKSDLTRMDAACSLASIIDGDVRVFSFSNKLCEVPHRLGMAGVDAIKNSQCHSSTYLKQALDDINNIVKYDRIIVITDEQNGDGAIPNPKEGTIGYVINVGTSKNGIGYKKWVHIDGFSEQILSFIKEYEMEKLG